MKTRLLIAGLAACTVLIDGNGRCATPDAPPDADAPEIDKAILSESHTVGGDPMKRYFLIRHKLEPKETPKEYGLLLILPDGSGSADFLPFCANVLTLYGAPKDVIVAELVAPVWNQQESSNIVWPGQAFPSQYAKFTSEEFVNDVISDVSQLYKIHDGWIFSLGWSSSGHVLYSSSFENPKIRGSFIAMSTFQADKFAHPENAKGKRYYFWHSPDDTTCPFAQSEAAASYLSKLGASTILKSYKGGHGWAPFTFYADRINEAIEWFCANDADAAEMKTKLVAESPTAAAVAIDPPATSAPASSSTTLANGIRVVSVYFPGSTNVSIITFLPLGVANDGPKQTQWSHLVEHLVIRSTIPGDLTMANAETLPAVMHLDFYGNTSNWKEGLSHHRRWLEGVPFTQAHLEEEKPRVKSEGDNTARQFYAHKFAAAAWAQGFRHDQTNAAVQGDIDRASLDDIQKYRDSRLAVLTNVVVCVVGGVAPAEVRTVVAEQFGAIKSSAKPAAPVKLHPGDRAMTWDLNARHLVMTWPIPASDAEDFPALFAAAQLLNMRLYSDTELKSLTGMTFAGADLAIPEGNFFYMSTSLRPGASFQDVQKKLEKAIGLLGSPDQDLSMLPMLGQQLAESLTTLPDIAALQAQIPPGTTPAMVEGNIGLQWGLNEYLYGPQKTVLAKRLSELKAGDVQRVLKKYLVGSKRSVITLRPATPQPKP